MILCRPLLHLSLLAVFLLPGRASSGNAPWFGGPGKAEAIEMSIPSTVKVSILHSRHPVAVSCTGSFSYLTSAKAQQVSLKSKSVLKLRGSKHGLVIGKKAYPSTLVVTPAEGESLTLNARPYRGKLFIKSRGSGVIDVIEQLPLEEYLYGVLPREVGYDWPLESLKAQAVISRTYVVANMRKSEGKGYDVTNDVSSQVYGGLQDEHPQSNGAVDATRGEILVDKDRIPVMTFFHSSCGGRTESPKYVWQEVQDTPDYLDSVKDPFCKEDPFYNWDFTISADALQRRLRRAGYRIGTPTKVSAAKRSPSNRVWVFEVESSKGRAMVPGNKFRLALGPEALRSTLLTEIRKQGKAFRFEGHGWGHGVGMCQWGARGRALEGEDYGQIIDAYYPNVRLVKAAR